MPYHPETKIQEPLDCDYGYQTTVTLSSRVVIVQVLFADVEKNDSWSRVNRSVARATASLKEVGIPSRLPVRVMSPLLIGLISYSRTRPPLISPHCSHTTETHFYIIQRKRLLPWEAHCSLHLT